MTEARAPLRTALIYDFDGTLARGNLQDKSFIPEVLGITPQAFWKNHVKPLTKSSDADEILIYLHLMQKLALEKGTPLTRELLQKHGKDSELFDGLADRSWFKRIGELGKAYGLQLEHYVISSGVFDMIKGCEIADEFEHIFASSFVFDESGAVVTPSVAINYTTKTQFLFRINKGIDNNWNNQAINAYMRPQNRRIPFSRMIFLGDGETDIPTMKMMHVQGGYSVAVYDANRSPEDLKKIHRLISDDRVNFVAAGDYTDGSALDIIIKGILGRIALANSDMRDLPEAP